MSILESLFTRLRSMGLIFLLGFLLCIFQSSESILVKVANNRPDPHPSSAKLLFLSELLKFTISYTLLSSNRGVLGGHQPIPLENEEDQKWRGKRLLNNDGDVNEDDEDDEQETRNDIDAESTPSASSSCDIPPILLFAVPGAIYFFNNNLTFILLSLMPAPTYVVLSNLKILTTGLFSFLFLHRMLTTVQWISLGILFLSTAVSQIDLEKGLSLSISIQAFLLMILFCSLSAAASVFSEYVMKERFAKESIHLQNMKLYMFGILFNGITYMLTPVAATTDPAQQSGFFSDMVLIHFFIILAYASLGLVTSAIIKFSGSITKVYASSMSMFFAALVSWLLLDDPVTVLFFVGCFGCCYALHLYYRVPADSALDASASAEDHGRAADGAGRDSTSSTTSSTTLAATFPVSSHNLKSAALTSVRVVDQNEYLSLDTMDDQEENQQQHHSTSERR
ncbi:hypothetical protein BG011_008328 [Mortierella polycephala]|uniref:Nucleotide-sugar transporter n=1 Tax=Mortierella polycephala TaxID=41804 RepID=A0A9P6TWQ3_9FUNG|nr:hypothetical protein BG011_008328 [Mortierella polycephala]